MSRVASLHAHKNFNFRVDPYNIRWGYNLRTHVEDTYGGKVVQILGVDLTTLTINMVAGAGGRTYVNSLLKFFKDMALWQQNTGKIAVFQYPYKRYNLKVWAQQFTVQDSLTNVVYPIQMQFAIQDDIAGTLKKISITKELDRLAEGIGYTRNVYNYPSAAALKTYDTPPNRFTSDPSTANGPATGTDTSLTAEQQSNAQAVINVGIAKGVGRDGVIIGVMTALTESTLVNVDHGDSMGPSSIGLFQQMPGWGPLSVRTDPAGSAGLFYDALINTAWQSKSPWQAAQDVQQSEFSDGSNYHGNYDWAVRIVNKLLGP